MRLSPLPILHWVLVAAAALSMSLSEVAVQSISATYVTDSQIPVSSSDFTIYATLFEGEQHLDLDSYTYTASK
jgi:hypothetical protein